MSSRTSSGLRIRRLCQILPSFEILYIQQDEGHCLVRPSGIGDGAKSFLPASYAVVKVCGAAPSKPF